MIKKLSLFLTALMLMNLFIFSDTNVSAAATESFMDYTFIDVEYSEPLGLFVAVGNKDNKGAAFASADGETWAKVANFSNPVAYGYSDCLVWWGTEGVFIAYCTTGPQTYISSDGYHWELKTIDGIKANGGIIVDQEDKLIHFYRDYVSIYDSFDVYTTSVYTTYTGAGGSQIYATFAVSGGTGATKTIYVVAGYRGGGSYNGGQTWNQIDAFVGTSTIRDWVYSKAQNCFYIASNDGTGKLLGRIDRTGGRSATDNVPFTSKIYSIGIGNGHLIVGNTDGNFYKAPDVSNVNFQELAWTKIPAEDSSAALSLPRRMAAGNGVVVAVCTKMSTLANSKGQIAVMNQDLTSYKVVENYNTSPYSIHLQGGTRFEVPAAGQSEMTVDLAPEVVDLSGAVLAADGIQSITAGALPSGVAHHNGVFTIEPDADAGIVQVTIVSNNGLTETFAIAFVREYTVEIKGYTDIAIPAYGAPPEEWSFEAIVIGTDGKPMARTATITVWDLPDGATFDSARNVIILQYDVELGTYKIEAVSDTVSTISSGEITGTISGRVANKVEITSGFDSLQIPETNALEKQFLVKVSDQTDSNMPFEVVTWTVKNAISGVTPSNVSISNNGLLVVDSNAYRGNLIITVTLDSNPDLYDTYNTELTFSDLRCAQEDTRALTIAGDLNHVTEDLTLDIAGAHETTISWKSSDTSIIAIAPLGKVVRPTTKNETVTLTATIVKDTGEQTKTFTITVLKQDNIFINGDFENADISAWKVSGIADIQKDNENKNGGTSSLAVKARTQSSDGVYQTFTLKNNASYFIEGYVKGSVSNQTFSINSDKAVIAKTLSKTINNSGFTRISGIVTYTKQTDAFDEVFKFYASGTDNFYMDDFKLEEVTIEYNALLSAITTAEYSKLQTDIDKAKALLESFYDVPEKEDLRTRLNNISPKTSGGTDSSGGRGTGGGGGGSVRQIIVPDPSQDIPDNTEAVADHLLIFKDLKGHWAKDDIEYMANLGFVSGREEGIFDPDVEITRAEFAVLAVRVLGSGEKPYANSFYDIVSEDWYSGYIQAAKDAGLINGSDGLFKPNDIISRQEMTKIVVAAYTAKTKTTLTTGGALYYSDYYDVSAWAYDYVVNAVDLGFINGVTESLFSPLSSATRAQSVIILKRFYDKLNNTEGGN